ncbi:MAG: hypothetical protein ACTSVI_10650 [Promethearchaeota archaeon]
MILQTGLQDSMFMDAMGALVGGVLSLSVALIAIITVIKKKTKTSTFFFLTWLFNALYLMLESMSLLTKDIDLRTIIFKINYSTVLTAAFIFWLLFLDYALNDDIGWKKMAIAFGYSGLLFSLIWHPANKIIYTSDGMTIEGLEFVFISLNNILLLMIVGTFSYWTIITFKKSPPTLKKYSIWMLIAGLSTLSGIFFVIIGEMFLMYVLTQTGVIISSIIVYKEPKMTHILPYRCYRLIITSKGGTPYVQYNWSEHEVNTILLAGLFSAIGSMAKATLDELNVGSIKEVRLQNGIFLTETQYSPVNIGLLASKASKDLRISLQKFAKEFLEKYKTLLYNEDGFPIEVKQDPGKLFLKEDIQKLIDNNFSNIPSYVTEGIKTENIIESALKKEENAGEK